MPAPTRSTGGSRQQSWIALVDRGTTRVDYPPASLRILDGDCAKCVKSEVRDIHANPNASKLVRTVILTAFIDADSGNVRRLEVESLIYMYK